MKLKSLIFSLAALAALSSCQSGGTSESVSLNNEIDSVSYSLGVLLGQNNKQSLDATPGADDLDIDIITNAFKDQLKGEESLIESSDAMDMIQAFFNKAQEQVAIENAEKGEAFLAENKTKEGVTTTESGLQYEILVEGDGEKPTETQTVTCHYTGMLLDGTVFDSSVERGEPASFPLNQVIAGWTEVLQLMPVGSKWKVYIPSELAYGETGVSSGQIGPNETLIFEIELLGIAD